ncbi:MAG TPA: MopE-related protein, partial [Kofleriaceae bacterium]|nr:MopE-related protein [Kofleriaceae bacterium]
MRATYRTTISLVRALAALAVALAATACGPSGATPGDGGPGDAGVVDATAIDAIGPDLGSPCSAPADCPGGYCVESPAGGVCTYQCDHTCPPGWECRITDVGGELVSVCEPGAFEVCTHCEGDDDCGAGDCVQLEGAGYCLPQCFEHSCPPGYTCTDDPTGTHPGDELCVPDSQSCSCNAQNAGAVRTCTRSNAIGTCTGFESCDPVHGWVGCSAADAAPEVCDGLDNDCDHLIDDGTGGGQCTIDVAGVGSCPGTPVCTGAGGVVCQGQTPSVERCNGVNDDCDLATDEGFPGLGNACSAGAGACQRFGVRRCTTDGLGTECSAVAGAPAPETCNGVDDNCNGAIDDPFVDLGQSCSVGTGTCVRQGTKICLADGTGTTCSAVPGAGSPEACNLLDDDCDGRVDEAFRDPITGVYDHDDACGSCAVDCTTLFDLPHASGSCDATGMPVCAMTCDPDAFDLDGVIANGCELVVDPDAIYVSINDAGGADDAGCGLGPVGTGAGRYPCHTIAQGLARAVATGRSKVLVANGLYDEAVTLVDGKSLLGGYSPDDWQRDVAATGTLIAGVTSVGPHDRTVVAIGIATPTVFEGFVVYGSVNGKPGGNSYAIYVSGSTANLELRGNVVFAGRGGPGPGGGNGAGGGNGGNGTGRESNAAAYDAHIATGAGFCDPASNNRLYANGAAGSCSGDDVGGGNGGGNQCPPSQNLFELSGLDGSSGQPGAGGNGGAAGAGTDAGDDMRLDSNGLLCYVPNTPIYGLDGLAGVAGQSGGASDGCGAPAGL